MEAARRFVDNHTSKRGHFTTVDEHIQPAVTWEVIKPHRHEITTEAVDREIHQHHYHTTVQPLEHKVALPEKHTHVLQPVRKVHHQHDDVAATEAKVKAFAAQFVNSSRTLPHTHSKSAAAPVVGEHFHHHVHETVQPIIYKTTHQKEVVHTTIPIHEVHIHNARHHDLSALPPLTLERFLAAGHTLVPAKGHTTHFGHEEYEGMPRAYNEDFNTTLDSLRNMDVHNHPAVVGSRGTNTVPTTGTTGTLGNNGVAGTAGSIAPTTPLRTTTPTRTSNAMNTSTTPSTSVSTTATPGRTLANRIEHPTVSTTTSTPRSTVNTTTGTTVTSSTTRGNAPLTPIDTTKANRRSNGTTSDPYDIDSGLSGMSTPNDPASPVTPGRRSNSNEARYSKPMVPDVNTMPTNKFTQNPPTSPEIVSGEESPRVSGESFSGRRRSGRRSLINKITGRA